MASVGAREGKKGVVTVGTQDTEAYAETEKTGWEMTTPNLLPDLKSSVTTEPLVESIYLGIVVPGKNNLG